MKTLRTRLLAPLGVAMAYFVLAHVSYLLAGDSVRLFWLPIGLAAALISTLPRHRLAVVGAVLVAATAVRLTKGASAGVALGLGMANSLAAGVSGWMLTGLPQGRRLARPRDLGVLVGAAVAGPLPGALLGAAVAAATTDLGFFNTWLARWTADGLGVFFLAPAVLAVISLRREPPPSLRLGRGVALTVATAATAAATLFLSEFTDRNLTYLIMVPLLLAALWWGQRPTSLLVAGATISIVGVTAAGFGPFAARESVLDPVVAAQMYMAVVQAMAMALAVEAGRRRDVIAELQGVFEAAVEGVMVVDETGTIRSANAAASTMFHVPRGVVGRHLRALLDVDEQETSMALVEGVRGDGTKFWAEVSSGNIAEPAGRRRRAIVVRDVNARIEAESQRDLLAEIIEATPDFVAYSESGETIDYLNPGGRRMLGIDLDTPLGHIPVGQLSPDWAQRRIREEAIPYALAHGTWTGESAYIGPDGEEIPVSQVFVGHPSLRGRPAAISSIAHDITDRKENERLQDQFVAHITHELRNPLTVVAGYADVLLEEEGTERFRPELEAIRRSAEKLRELIDEILHFKRARSESGYVMAPVDLEGLVREAVTLVSGAAYAQEVKVSAKLEAVGTITGDQRQVDRAVHNLISNAIKYSKPGGEVRVELVAEGPWARLTVADDGIGIAPQDLGRLFERFFRATSATESGIPGTGLGLTMVREVARHHGGDVKVESTLGVGTTFVLSLPLAWEESIALEETEDGPVRSISPLG